MIVLPRFITVWLICLLASIVTVNAQTDRPAAVSTLLTTLKFTPWEKVQDGFSSRRIVTPAGMIFTAFRISPKYFNFLVVEQENASGSTAQEIGQVNGAMLVANGGFFAMTGASSLYPVGYLRIDENIRSKAWKSEGGFVNFLPQGPVLTPSHSGIPANKFDVLQTRPMLIEPGGKWAMNQNSFEAKNRTIFCRMANGDVVLATFTRVGLSLYEAGWVFRHPDEGGFFGCESAVAMDGGGSTQIWYSADESYSQSGRTPVQNFLVISEKRED